MTYSKGLLASVTNGATKYYFDSDPVNDLYRFGIKIDYDKHLLIQSISKQGWRSVSYYGVGSDGNVDTFTLGIDKFGKPTGESYNGQPMVSYFYTGESLSAELSHIVDDYIGQEYVVLFKDDQPNGWRMGDFKVEQLGSGTRYSFGSSEVYDVITESDQKSPFARGTKVYEESGSSPKELEIFSCDYTYAGIGLLYEKKSKNGTYSYSYPQSGSRVLPIATGCTYTSPQASLAWQAELDKTGNITRLTETINGYSTTHTYEYDSFGSMIKEDGKEYTYDTHGRMSTAGGEACEYDKFGRLVRLGDKELSYDKFGNRTFKAGEQYFYTRGNLLESISHIASYKYDRNGLRYTKHIQNAESVKIVYHYNNDQLIGEDHSDGWQLRFFYDRMGPSGFRLIDGKTTKDYTYIRNLLGDVVAIGDESGKIVARYEYDAWGKCRVLDPAGTENASLSFIGTINPLRYRGYYYDYESGLYYLITRYYDPETMNFLTRDSTEYMEPMAISGLDLYAYCGNNPLMRVDPDGTVGFLVLLAGFALGFLLSAGIELANEVYNGGGWENVNVGKVLFDGLIGGIGGIATASGLNVLLMALVGAGLGFAQGVGDSYLTGKSFTDSNTWWSIGFSAFAGLVAYSFGGAGAKYGVTSVIGAMEYVSASTVESMVAIGGSQAVNNMIVAIQLLIGTIKPALASVLFGRFQSKLFQML